MKLITQRILIQEVAAKWRKQYEPFQHDSPLFSYRDGIAKGGLTKRQIADALDKLDGNTATPEQVEEIIGNSGWTRINCDECRAEVLAVVEVGQEPDYESATACICLPCLAKAYALIREAGR